MVGLLVRADSFEFSKLHTHHTLVSVENATKYWDTWLVCEKVGNIVRLKY
jgi:hypothetical protein